MYNFGEGDLESPLPPLKIKKIVNREKIILVYGFKLHLWYLDFDDLAYLSEYSKLPGVGEGDREIAEFRLILFLVKQRIMYHFSTVVLFMM